MEGIKAELKRVRNLKRNAETALDAIRSDNEQGWIHIRVNQDPGFKAMIAEAIVNESHPGGVNGAYYADPVAGKVYFKEATAAWDPWSDSVDFRIVRVWALIDDPGDCDFSPEVDWAVVSETASKAEQEDIAYQSAVSLAEDAIKDEIILRILGAEIA